MKLTRALAVLLFTTAHAMAQQPAPPPMLRTTLEPAKVIVGQPATLVVEVLAPNYMTRPPVLPDFQIRNAVTRAGSTVNMSDRQGDVNYAGIRYEFLIYPQEAGRYSVVDQSITVTYASDPPNTREVVLPVPAASFEAIIPQTAQSLDPFVSASGLTLRQEIQRSSDPLKIGDAVTRIVTIEAEGTPAMLLPPTNFASIAGAKLYPSQPELSERVDRRTGMLSAVRTDRATYMLEAAATVTLPALEIAWWNVKDQKVERAQVESVALQILDDPSRSQSGPMHRSELSEARKLVLFVLDHWLAIVLGVGLLALMIGVLPAVTRGWLSRMRRRRAAYRQSEAFAYSELRRVSRRGDARAVYAALLNWLSRFEPAAPSHTLQALKNYARDPALADEIAVLEKQLFAKAEMPAPWSPRLLIRRVASARRKGDRRRFAAVHSLPRNLNPGAASASLPNPNRAIAR
jgi:hypothetical protein